LELEENSKKIKYCAIRLQYFILNLFEKHQAFMVFAHNMASYIIERAISNRFVQNVGQTVRSNYKNKNIFT